jgi:hypothetical protein
MQERYEAIPGESSAARAKREEAEMEPLNALRSQGEGAGEYEESPLPRWEPRRPPPGRGPGSIDETTAASAGLTVDPKKSDTVPDEPPPSYS